MDAVANRSFHAGLPRRIELYAVDFLKDVNSVRWQTDLEDGIRVTEVIDGYAA